MQQFARGLQHRWGQLWQLCAAQTPVIAQDQARDYCQRLLNGGLQMFVQPVVDLQSGHLVKVEPPRVWWRLQLLRRWSHEEVTEVQPRGSRARRAHGCRGARRLRELPSR